METTKYKCPYCSEMTNNFGKCEGQYYCVNCKKSFFPFHETKPCPICGNYMITCAIQSYHGREHYRVYCECGVAGSYEVNEWAAIEKWNKLFFNQK